MVIPPYAVHTDQEIKGFFGPFRFLSNFYPCQNGVFFEGLWFPTSEQAYQASKIESQFRSNFVNISAGQSKHKWKEYPLIYTEEEWNAIKADVMSNIVFDKFFRNGDLRKQLLDTHGKYLEETNNWGDNFFGTIAYFGGKNHLGRILMKVRDFWRVV